MTTKSQLLNLKVISDSLVKLHPAEKIYLQTDKTNYATGDTLWYKAYLFNAPTLAMSSKSGIMYVNIANDSATFVKHYRLSVKQDISWGNIGLVDFPAGKYSLTAYTTWMRDFGVDCFFNKQFTVTAENNSDPNTIDLPKVAAIKKRSIKSQVKQQKAIQNTEVQFLSEGGSLIAGLPARIGFKAIGEDGKGVNVSGVILDNNNQQTTSFTSLYRGMGSFVLSPQHGKRYHAKVNLPGGQSKEYALPEIKDSGTILHVSDAGKDSLFVSVAVTGDIIQSHSSYFLIAKARNVICYAATLNFDQSGKTILKIAKNLFPSGVAHFVLMNTEYQPLNERLAFINHDDNLKIETGSYKQIYNSRDSVNIALNIKDINGNPIAGNFSIAVTDNSQVNIDSLAENMVSRILLSSEIKGYLEEPGYYLQDNLPNLQALDNLMLTQGWVNYNWQPGNKKIYAAERDFAVNGQVFTGLQKPFSNVKVTLLSANPIITKDTLTDNNGHFSFKNFPPIDKPAFILQAVNRHGKSFNVGIKMDDPEPPLITKTKSVVFIDTTIDTIMAIAAKNNRIRNEQSYLSPNGHLLKEVKVKAQKIVKGSQNLNGPGNADYLSDSKTDATYIIEGTDGNGNLGFKTGKIKIAKAAQ